MKKKLVIAALMVLSIGATTAVLNAKPITKHIHEEGILATFKCNFCNGTGLKGNFVCVFCQGRGHNGSY